jgi:hypothetical protein
MGLELIESENFPIYKDGRVFDWEDCSYYMTLGEYSVMHRYGDIWEVFYKMANINDCERLSWGSKEFCMKLVEHKIRQDEQ